MKLSLNINQLGGKTAKEVQDFIASDQAIEIVEKDNCLSTAYGESCSDFSQTDIFEMGMAFAKDKADKFHKTPEAFWLQNSNAELFQKAINEYEKESYIRVDSIEIKKGQVMSEIIIKPTQTVHLFNIIMRYGKMLVTTTC